MKKDENQIAARILWQLERHHSAMEKLRARDIRMAWKAAAADLRRKPAKPRSRTLKLTPEQLARIGTVEGL